MLSKLCRPGQRCRGQACGTRVLSLRCPAAVLSLLFALAVRTRGTLGAPRRGYSRGYLFVMSRLSQTDLLESTGFALNTDRVLPL